jgi:CDP-4-dehydro-6-deoxyglucose reductase, E1
VAVGAGAVGGVGVSDGPTLAERRAEILRLVGQYVAAEQATRRPFVPGRSPVPYAGRVYDAEEVTSVVGAALDFWLTAGPMATRLEGRLAGYVGTRHCALVNSGSSANLLAFATLTSPRLGDRRIEPGDEVITVAAGFPTTVAPIVQFGAVPVFVDVRADTANIDTSMLELARSSRTKAVMVAHTLGNPFDVDAVARFCRRHGLWLVEDNCDALGATYTSEALGETRRTGAFGDLSTSSFYPAHHMTTGEGGAVYTSDDELAAIVESVRDWGRDCYCKSGKDNTCGKRFAQQFGQLPMGYDHKFVYSHFGFNLKMTDLQAAVGVAQAAKLDGFVAARRRNHARLYAALSGLEDRIDLPVATPKADPSWFGFLLVPRDVPRAALTGALEAAHVQTRTLFGGNLVRQPCFDGLRGTGRYRVVGDLAVADRLMERAVWVGVYPGLGDEQIDYVAATIRRAVERPDRALVTASA